MKTVKEIVALADVSAAAKANAMLEPFSDYLWICHKSREALQQAIEELVKCAARHQHCKNVLYADDACCDDVPLAALRTERDQLKAKNEKLVEASEMALGELDWFIENHAGRSTIKAANTLRDALKENT